MIRLAIIRNPRSARNLGRRSRYDCAEPTSPQELARMLEAMRVAGVDLLVIDGGDGTVRDVLTELAAMAWGPRLAVVPSGKINLIAGDVGARLDHVVGAAEFGWGGFSVERRPLIRLERAGQRPAFGMFLGACAFTAGWQLANNHLHPRGVVSGPAIAAALAMTLMRDRRKLAQTMSIAVDDCQLKTDSHFLLLVTTLERLALGLWPFWPDGNAGGLHWLEIEAPPRRLLASLHALARGKPSRRMLESGYHGGDAQRIVLRTEAPVILDGEAFHAGPDGQITLSSGPVMEFARP
jgi:diacylglycerol kinase family enzyme